jgi:PGM1 C-terminal domain
MTKDPQLRLAAALEANRPESDSEHVVVALPSFSVGESLLSHYVDRIPMLEHRYLVAQLVLHRIPSCRMIYISSQAPSDDVLDYYARLGPRQSRDRAKSSYTVVEVPDASGRSVAAKLLDRPDLLGRVKTQIGTRPAFIEPWNVTEAELHVAEHLGLPINGTLPYLRHLGFKSEGRRLLRAAGVPVPFGVEMVTSMDDVVRAVAEIRAARPSAVGAVIKLDDSGAGDGNVVLDLRPERLTACLAALPDWYVAELSRGGVVEELVTGTKFRSPSAQLDIMPDGEVRVLATHEQVLGGPNEQVYLGCRMPADTAYAPVLAQHAATVGRVLAAQGAIGRVSVDFAAACDTDDQWSVYALEVNIRKGGTTHPYTVLRSLVPGRYDAERGTWLAADGTERAYSATDNMLDPSWTALRPTDVMNRVRSRGLEFDPDLGTGVVLHMLTGVSIDGRIGLTAIGYSPNHAAQLHDAVAAALSEGP